MTSATSIGVAVIGGGMAGRAHAAGYRTATTLFGTDRPDVRLVAIGDTNAAVADDTAKRYGYERAEYDWHAIAEAPDIDAVVYFTEADPSSFTPGAFVEAELVGARGYDLLAKPIDQGDGPGH